MKFPWANSKKKQGSGISRKFYIPTFLLLALIVLFMSIFFVKQYYKDYEETVKERVSFINGDIMSWYDSVGETAIAMSVVVENSTINQDILNIFAKMKERDPIIKDIYFGSTVPLKDGGLFLSMASLPSNYNQTKRPWYLEAIKTEGKNVIATEPYLDTTGAYGSEHANSLVITFANAVYTNKSLHGVLAIDLSLSKLFDIIENYDKHSATDIALLYNDGRYLIQTNTEMIMNENANFFSKIPADIKSNIINNQTSFTYDNNYFYASSKISATGWYVLEYGKTTEVREKVIRLITMFMIAVILIFVAQYILVNKIVIPLSNILSIAAKNTKSMSEGDFFAVSFDDKFKKRKDEAGVLISSIDEMKKSLVSTLDKINISSNEIAGLMTQMDSNINNLSARTENQASSLEEVSSSVEEMNISMKETTENAKTASIKSVTVKETAHSGVELMNKNISNMQDIYNSSKKISDITTVIEKIALQTNILALNAAVEAARAGDQGRGFAVVASEVRALALNTSNSVKDIAKLINDTVAKIESAKTAAEKSGAILGNMEALVNEVSLFLADISNAVTKEESSIEQIKVAIDTLNTINQENVIVANSSLEVSKQVVGKTDELLKKVSFFKF